jgi:predicted GNAT superfamily acetyltransferase
MGVSKVKGEVIMSDISEISYRIITEVSEVQEVVKLQKTAWSQEMITSMPQMAAAILHGGIIIGAFDGENLIGFNYGFAGYDGCEAYLGSHMMAIHHDYRDRGIGMRLKFEQRLCAIRYGYRKIVWTYDPFEARNAYLNLSKLGGKVNKYISSFYGEDREGLPTDRFMVEWDITTEQVEEANVLQHEITSEKKNYPSLLTYTIDGENFTGIEYSNNHLLLGHIPGCLIPIPRMAHELKSAQSPLFLTWQSYLRCLCSEAFLLHYQVVSFIRGNGPVHYYVLEVKR